MSIAGCAVVAGAIDVGVGDCHVSRSLGAQDDVLSCDIGSLAQELVTLWVVGRMKTYGNVVDPDIVCSIQGDGISTPNIFRVDVGDLNVL